MAEIRSIYTDKRKDDSRRRTGYVEGTAVRKLQASGNPAEKERRESRLSFFLADDQALAAGASSWAGDMTCCA